MRIYDIIDKKRRGIALTQQEIDFFVRGYIAGDIADYHMSALLMAICINGMTDEETAILTEKMASSGDMLDLSRFGDGSVDKHSTGGVGDKTTLVIAPIVASLGCTVCKLSGRGLGHTGGTLDKLESIPGCRIDHAPEEFMKIASLCGLSVCGAGANIAPADKKMYALRDVTATVSSIPLIVSSIMSKKLAGGAKSIVLDVKIGSGAFMKTLDDAKELANRMVSVGRLNGRRVSAVITNMDYPLGYCIGNSLEVAEAVSLLKGEKRDSGLYEVCVTLASEMVALSKSMSVSEARPLVEETVSNGNAYKKFLEWISLQGGDVSVFDDLDAFSGAKYQTTLLSPADGFIASADAEGMGISAMMLGAGRQSKDDHIDPTAGVIQLKRVGDRVEKGDPLAIFRSSSVPDHTHSHARWLQSLSFTEEQPPSLPLVYEIIR